MNLNYVGSLAQTRMRFRSTTDVVVNNTNELFNAQTVYVPKRFAAQNIIGWDDSFLTAERPAVYVVVVDNYARIMTGDLLSQWQPVFRQDTNGDVVIYLVVFEDAVASGWSIQPRMITYAPLTAAFTALFSFSYFKYLFDPHSDGRDVVIPASPGSPAQMRIRLANRSREGLFARQDVVFTNPSMLPGNLVLEAGTYTYNDGTKIWEIVVTQDYALAPDGGNVVLPGVQPTTIGEAPNLVEGQNITNLFYGTLPTAGIVVTSTNIVNGVNPGVGSIITIPAGSFLYNDGARVFTIAIPTDMVMRPDDVSAQVTILATTVGVDPNLGQGLIDGNLMDRRLIAPPLPVGIVVMVTGTTQGTNPVAAPFVAPSQYFDLSLALAYQCKNNMALSWMWSLVKISYEDRAPNPQDRCWIRYLSRADQLAGIRDQSGSPSLLAAPRDRYYWAMLHLMECQNTSVIVHSEFQYIIADILAAWFATRNASGSFIGNKLSLLRLSGTRIKPLGWPSWLDSSVNENDADGQQQLRDMNVGHLATIADNTPQESYLTMARGIGDIDKGIPVTMQMIAKFVDYTCSQEAAKMVTSTGSLTDPILTDEDAYQEIQRLVGRTLGRFAGTNGRIFNIIMAFPEFAVAKKSRTALSAASAWRAWYKDDLDEVEVSGGITAE